jgi:O-methyltransferase
MAQARWLTRALRRRRSIDPRLAEIEGLEGSDRSIVEAALPYTMTSAARLVSVIDAVRDCVRRGIDGDFAECGVWRGGSVLAMILTLQDLGRADRDVHLFDTFEGMTAPTAHDVSPIDGSAVETWANAERAGERAWAGYFPPELVGLEPVSATLLGTGYPAERLHFVAGPVELTIPDRAPDRLALLRLDTDWYESTRHELLHLYPRLAPGGVLIIDDYGHWEGCRRAVDEYFRAEPSPPILRAIDYTGRIAVKP